MNSTCSKTGSAGTPARLLAALMAVTGTMVWSHALAGVIRAALDIAVADLAQASLTLTIASALTALAAVPAYGSLRGTGLLSGVTSLAAIGLTGLL